jgi:hypothetical protein
MSTRNWFKSFFAPDARKSNRLGRPPLVAYFWDGGEPVAHAVQNISPTGFYLLTRERWLLGTLIMMTLQRTSTDSTRADCSVIVMSKVVRYGDDGVGFVFVPIESPNSNSNSHSGPGSHPADRKTLDKFLHLLESDPGYAVFGYLLLLLLVLFAATYGIKGGAFAIAFVLMACAMRTGFSPRAPAVASTESIHLVGSAWRKDETTAGR